MRSRRERSHAVRAFDEVPPSLDGTIRKVIRTLLHSVETGPSRSPKCSCRCSPKDKPNSMCDLPTWT